MTSHHCIDLYGRQLFVFLGLALFCGSVFGGEHKASDDYELQRALFQQARLALTKEETQQFKALQSQLTTYPIAHYLEYERLRKLIRKKPSVQSAGLIENYREAAQDDVLANRLGADLLSALAKHEQWFDYIKVVKASAYKTQSCDLLLAKVLTQKMNSFDANARGLWLKPRTHPEHCQQAFERLEKTDAVTVAMVWERIYALMQRGRTKAVESMYRYLSSSDKQAVAQWVSAYAKPSRVLKETDAFAEDNTFNRRAIVNLVKRWSLRDSVAAHKFWNDVKRRYFLSRDTRYEVDALIARMAAFDRVPQAQQWLSELPDDLIDKKIRYWRIRAALYNLDWQSVATDIRKLPTKEQGDQQWRYWLARALEQTGKAEDADVLYKALANELSFHGFLAADRLGSPYSLEHSLSIDHALRREMASNAVLVRAREYHYADLPWEGRREWMSEVAKMASQAERYATADLALHWELPDRALFTVAKTGNKTALDLRFPTLFDKDIGIAADRNDLDPAWIYGVMRRESGFITDIRSGAGAVGLMQLMPATAKEVARKIGNKRTGDLTNISNNITLGSSYLRSMLNRFNDHQILATAAYNAGPSRVKRWLPKTQSLPADVWIDTIPYKETRRYVRAVTAYTAIFEWQLRRKVTRLKSRMSVIQSSMLLSSR